MAEMETPEVLPQEEDTSIDPPAVLNVNSPSPPDSSSTATDRPRGVHEEFQPSEREVPATIPGLSEMINEWQISSIPEEKQFFSTNGNVFDAAVTAIKSHFDENDSVVRKAWLLTEIDHWDLERERIVVLTNNNLVVVKYNFIQQVVEELRFIPLGAIKKLSIGKFSYTYSVGHSRSGRGIKIYWGDDLVSFSTRWNPFSSTVPYTVITSHVLVMRNQTDNPTLKFDDLPDQLQQAVKDYQSRAPSGAVPEVPVVEEDIVFDYYLGLTAMVHNQSFLGFFKKRGALNW